MQSFNFGKMVYVDCLIIHLETQEREGSRVSHMSLGLLRELSKALQPETSAQFTWFSLTLLLPSGTAESGACKESGSALSCDLGEWTGWIPPWEGGEGQPSSFISLGTEPCSCHLVLTET